MAKLINDSSNIEKNKIEKFFDSRETHLDKLFKSDPEKFKKTIDRKIERNRKFAERLENGFYCDSCTAENCEWYKNCSRKNKGNSQQ